MREYARVIVAFLHKLRYKKVSIRDLRLRSILYYLAIMARRRAQTCSRSTEYADRLEVESGDRRIDPQYSE